MKMFKLKYILSWLAMIVIILVGLLLMVFAWNGQLGKPASPSLLVMLWVILVAAAIYLLFFATRQTLNDYIADRKTHDVESAKLSDQLNKKKTSSEDQAPIKPEAATRKIIRGISSDNSREENGNILLKNLASELEIMSGLVYFRSKNGIFKAKASYALQITDEPYKFKEGEGLTGQVAKNRQVSILNKLPEDSMEVSSGLGQGKPAYLAIVPVEKNNKTIIVIECSGFKYDINTLQRLFVLLGRELSAKISEFKSF